MEPVILVIDVIRTAADVLLTFGPTVRKLYRRRRERWAIQVMIGAKATGTPARDVEQLLDAFDNRAFFVRGERHPVLDEVRRSLWQAYQKIDELQLIAVAEGRDPSSEREFAILEIGQRCGKYAIENLKAIEKNFHAGPAVREAATRAIAEIERRSREADGEGAALPIVREGVNR